MLAYALLLGTLLICGAACSRTVPMDPGDDLRRYVDYADAAKRFPGMSSTQVQGELGSPTDIQRPDSARVVWQYDHRFCEADARCIYKHVFLTFEDHKLTSMRTE